MNLPPFIVSLALAPTDWVVLGVYVAILAGAGVYFARRAARTTDEYFLAAHGMPVWAVAFSILATAQSAATFVAVPQSSYTGNLAYLAGNIGAVIGAVILATVFIPAYYRRRASTPYELLESRFGPSSRLATACVYLGGRVFASGARLFVGALPASLALFGDTEPAHLAITIALFTIFGIAFTFLGGVSSVIWTDVLQVSVYLGAAVVVALVLWSSIPVSTADLVHALAHPPPGPDGTPSASKLTVVSLGLDPAKPGWGFDPSMSFTLLTSCTGLVLLTLASHGMDQDLVQRMLTCRSSARGAWSVIAGVLVGVPTVTLFLVIGLLLYVFYQRPDVMGAAAPPLASLPADSRDVFQHFAFRELAPGLAGLFLCGVFAAGPAGLNAGLNSMSSTFVGDVYRRFRPPTPARPDAHYLFVGRLGVLAAGLLLGGFAMLCIWWQQAAGQSLIDFVLSVMNFAYAGLLGVFLTALFTRRGNSTSVLAALVVGFVAVLMMNPLVWPRWTPWLGVGLDGVKLAFPWQLVIGAGLATAACALGMPKPGGVGLRSGTGDAPPPAPTPAPGPAILGP